MSFTLPELPYSRDALAPHMSKETLDYHYGKHHKTYVDKANGALDGSGFENASLEEIIKESSGFLFNQCAQIWNHTFFWHSLSPNGGGEPGGDLRSELEKQFGSVDEFKEKFTNAATTIFGSGWAWLAKNNDGSLEVVATKDGDNPMTAGQTPLLTVDMWEHAFYIDYRNDKGSYLSNAFWNLANWDYADKNLSAA
jgi:Fe-Mn family superoxide dismutase